MDAQNPYRNHIPESDFHKATCAAHADIRKFTAELPLPWKSLGEPRQIDCPGPDYRTTDAVLFAQITAGFAPSLRMKLPDGYASWLMVSRKNSDICIAVDSDQTEKWSQDPDRPTAYSDVQRARCIYHEIGHLRTTKHLIHRSIEKSVSRKSDLAVRAKPEDEVAPWMYAAAVLGVMLAQYSYHTRDQRDMDDTPSVQI